MTRTRKPNPLWKGAVVFGLLFSWQAYPQIPGTAAKSGLVLVNAVATEGVISAQYAGKPILSPKGLKRGRATSGLGLPVGSGQLSISHSSIGSAQISVTLAKGTTPVAVAFESDEGKSTANPTSKPKLGLRTFPTKTTGSKGGFQVLWVTSEKSGSLPVKINQRETVLEPWQIKEFSGRSISLSHKSQEIGAIDIEGEEGCFVFVFGDEGGGYATVFVPQIIYTWD